MASVRGNSRGRRALAVLAALAAFSLAACQTDQIVTGSIPAGNAIAFESIDGPPEPVFDRLVAVLAAEADARKMPVVSRAATAGWRVRLYLAAHVDPRKTTIDWVADVFDARLERAFRVAGEETVAARRDVWAQADDALIARIAAKALDAIAAGINGERPASPAPEPRGGGPVVAMADPGL
jgi:hypothetical protein